MQKVVDFLERYCQWVAVAIGAVFFLFALSQYLPGISSPVEVAIGDRKLTPGDAEREILELAASPLESRMNTPVNVRIDVPNYKAAVEEKITAKPKVAEFPASIVASRVITLPDLPWDVNPNQPQTGAIVMTIPQLSPAALDPAPTTGFAQVNTNIQPSVPVPPVGDVNGPKADVTWVRVPFSVSMSQMDRAFRTANYPAAFINTAFVRVELIRQRELPNGQWEAEEIVKPIDTAGLIPVPMAPPAAQLVYKDWAIAHQQQIVQPQFFPFILGEHPLQAKPEVAVGPDGNPATIFNPETYTGPLDALTDEQRKAVLEARQRKAKEAEEQRRNQGRGQGTGPGTGRSGRGGAGGGDSGGPAGRSDDGKGGSGEIELWQAPPPGYPGGGFPGGGYPGGYPGEGGFAPPPGGMPGADIIMNPVANQLFVPQAGAPDIQGHAFDMTAKPGATYRYRIRYSILNPLFQINNVVPPTSPDAQQLVNQFELVGEDPTLWTESVTVKQNTHVFLGVAPSVMANAPVRFTIFHWQNGKWNRTIQNVTAGDTIGRAEGEIDYRSNYTLVEVRKNVATDRNTALLMMDDGSTVSRDFETDRDSALFKDLTAQVDGPTIPTPPPGGPGGYPPPGGGPGGYPPPGMPGSGAVP